MTQQTGKTLRAALFGAIALSSVSGAAYAQRAPDPDGTIYMDGVKVPITSLASPEGKEFLRKVIVEKPFANPAGPSKNIAEERAWQNVIMGRFLEPMRKRYAVTITEERIGGIVTDVVVPAGGVKPENRNRVLLNVHGGGFTTGSRSASLVESVPIAATMGIKVISIDYRMAPEFKFPAGSEDVEKVYREVLKTHDAKQVGLYGCSAGGMLTGQSVAWFIDKKLPTPAAIGVFCASLGGMAVGDSGPISAALNGMVIAPRPAPDASSAAPPRLGYLDGVAADNPLAVPEKSPELLKKFPPTLFITGTRAMEMSGAITSNNALTMAGVESRLHIWDGMIHGFFYNSEMPESREAYKVIADFFSVHLKR